MMNEVNWISLLTSFGFAENRNAFVELTKVHSSKSRYYHTHEHISACLQHLETVRDGVTDWKMLGLAFWFHDAIYKPFSSTNERDSADWAMAFLKDIGASAEHINRIEALIMATCHDGVATDDDMQIFIDIDLSILGARSDVYDEYEQNIRKEYNRVPGFIFRKKRKALLQSFLDKPRIFGSSYFYDLLEEQARVNLQSAIGAL